MGQSVGTGAKLPRVQQNNWPPRTRFQIVRAYTVYGKKTIVPRRHSTPCKSFPGTEPGGPRPLLRTEAFNSNAAERNFDPGALSIRHVVG
jgi:hypothetical protein